MGKPEERFKVILTKLENSNIPTSDFHKLDIVQKINCCTKRRLKLVFCAVVSILFYTLFTMVNFAKEDKCVIDMPQDASKAFREPEYCDICENVSKVEKIANVSPSVFFENYVKLTHPVVVADGAYNWPALKMFNFNFFKNLFNSIEINRSEKKNCQFFPYQTEFRSLHEVFKMKQERALLKPGEKPWYIGWNNCNDDAGKYLKQFYEIPYFLSDTFENIALSWIFMGGPGHGAHMHVDNVHYSSWQAQLSGKKLWKLSPPPECLYKCKDLQIIVEPGEIIVLDTNRWYHQTMVLPGEISITIGSEFD